jgi:hypothetical protein
MTDKLKYQNKTKTTQALIGYGTVLPGQTIETDREINNPNFGLVDTRRLVGVEAPVEQPAPGKSVKKGSK